MIRLSEHLLVETNFMWANVGAAVTESGILLLDCPVRPTDSQKWQQEVGSLSPLGVKFLISTDFHGDHVTGASFVDNVTFIAPRMVYDHILRTGGRDAFSKQIFTDTLRDQGHLDEAELIEKAVVPLPQICFDDSLYLYLPPLTFEIRRFGGHTPACSVVYIPEEKVIFAGDIVIESPCPGMRDANIDDWLRALEWIEGLPVDRIVPGHGNIGGKEILNQLGSYLTDIRENMITLVKTGLEKHEAVADKSFDRFFTADTTSGAYWAKQREQTFREGLEKLYEDIRGN
ncbi:MBL fold metallo-hydrolase [Thermodesulfobacteriota bacterium]